MDQNECLMELNETIRSYRNECVQLVGISDGQYQECTEECFQIETTDQNVIDACTEECDSQTTAGLRDTCLRYALDLEMELWNLCLIQDQFDDVREGLQDRRDDVKELQQEIKD